MFGEVSEDEPQGTVASCLTRLIEGFGRELDTCLRIQLDVARATVTAECSERLRQMHLDLLQQLAGDGLGSTFSRSTFASAFEEAKKAGEKRRASERTWRREHHPHVLKQALGILSTELQKYSSSTGSSQGTTSGLTSRTSASRDPGSRASHSGKSSRGRRSYSRRKKGNQSPWGLKSSAKQPARIPRGRNTHPVHTLHLDVIESEAGISSTGGDSLGLDRIPYGKTCNTWSSESPNSSQPILTASATNWATSLQRQASEKLGSPLAAPLTGSLVDPLMDATSTDQLRQVNPRLSGQTAQSAIDSSPSTPPSPKTFNAPKLTFPVGEDGDDFSDSNASSGGSSGSMSEPTEDTGDRRLAINRGRSLHDTVDTGPGSSRAKGSSRDQQVETTNPSSSARASSSRGVE